MLASKETEYVCNGVMLYMHVRICNKLATTDIMHISRFLVLSGYKSLIYDIHNFTCTVHVYIATDNIYVSTRNN